MRNLICVRVTQVFHNVQFRQYVKLKLRILLNPKLINKLCLVQIFYIFDIFDINNNARPPTKKCSKRRNSLLTPVIEPNMVSKPQMLKSSNMQTQISMRKKSKYVSYISR